MQEAAKLAYDDQVRLLKNLDIDESHADQVLRHLAQLGKSGSATGNIHRDLVTYLGEPSIPKAFKAAVHVKVEKPRRGQSSIACINMSFLLPHEFFHYLYTKRPVLWRDIMLGGSSENVALFWKGVKERKDPRFQLLDLSPVTKKTNWEQKAIPFSIHGDAVPVIAVGKAGTKSLDMTSQQSLLACEGSSLWVKQPICGIFEQSKVKNDDFDTDAEAGDVLLWSYKALQNGKWPAEDHRGRKYAADSAEGMLAGQDLADGYCGVLYIEKSDLDFLAKRLGLRHYSAHAPCDLCPCTKAGEAALWPSNFGPDSQWINALYTPEEWRALYPNVPHWLFSLLHFCQLNIEPDELHIIWLGTAMWCDGSVLWMLVFRVMPDTPSKNMQALWQQISECYAELRTAVQYTNLSIGSFCDPAKPSGHYPKLKGKGAEVKHLSAVLCKVWATNMDPDCHEHRLIADLLLQQQSFACIIDNHANELFLPVDQADKLQMHIITFLRLYTELGHIADANGDLLWNVTTKFHWLYHIGQRLHTL